MLFAHISVQIFYNIFVEKTEKKMHRAWAERQVWFAFRKAPQEMREKKTAYKSRLL